MNQKQTIGILAHVDAGKTTLSEAMLFLSGALRRAGRVDHGDTFLDTDSIERARGITIFSKQARFSYGGTDFTLLDTPGHVDFSAETERTLQVLSAAILVISGTDGVQGHTRTLWRLLDHYQVPVFLFVNKMDLPGADRAALMENLRKELSGSCLDFTPLFPDDAASGAAADFAAADASAAAAADDALSKRLAACPSDFLEETAMCSDALLDEYSESGSLQGASVRQALAGRMLFPVLFGSALNMEGVRALMSMLTALGPDAADTSASPDARFGARVYKISRDAAGNRLTFIKVTNGSLSVKDAVGKDKIDQIRLYSGDRYELREQVTAGDICAVTGLTDTLPGMGLGTETDVIRPVLEAVMVRAMLLPPGISAPSFFRKIRVLEEEDPSLCLVFDEKTGEIRAQIMGQVQIEVLTRMIQERFGVAVTFGPEKILYKETLLEPVIGIGHFEPLRHYAEAVLLLEGAERGSGVTVASAASEDVLALNWQRLILTHVLEREHPGVLTGSPVTDIKVTLLTGRAHLKHTEGGDFRQATCRAIRQGLKSGRCALLEPYYHFVLEIPSDSLGRALSDLSRMHASFGDPTIGNGRAVLEGRVPVSAVGTYASEVSAYTAGNGSLTLTGDGYDLCHDADQVLAGQSYDSEADPDNPTGSVFCAHGAGYLVPWDQVPSYAHCEIPKAALEKVRDILTENGLMPPEDDPNGYGAENGWGRRAPGGNSRPDRPLEEDAEFMAIYAREFGMDRDGIRMDEEKRNRAHNAAAHGKKKTSGQKYPEVRQKYDKQGRPIFPKKDTRAEYLIVDGYNIIFQWKDLNELARASVDAARGKLLDILSNYQGFTGQKVTVVFDAYRTERSPQSITMHQNIEVVFTKKEETADAYIERLVHESADRYKITVATSDGLEQLTVLRLGALRMSARMLEEEIARVTSDWSGNGSPDPDFHGG